MAEIIDAVLGVGESSSDFLVNGYCDIVVSGLTAGAVKMQYMLSKTTALPVPTWTDFPDGSFTTDVFNTVFISADDVRVKMVGVANNAGVYVRITKHLVH